MLYLVVTLTEFPSQRNTHGIDLRMSITIVVIQFVQYSWEKREFPFNIAV